MEVVTPNRPETVGETDTQEQVTARSSYAAPIPMPVWKRWFDVLFAAIGLIVLTPVFIFTSIFIKFVSRGPILFRQTRYGLHGHRFVIYKFRTMSTDADCHRHQQYVRDLAKTGGTLRKRDITSRIIPGGRLLRKLGIDELPQLINVLLGTMSLVGPRPDLLAMVDYETWQQPRFDVVPGITGLWQVSGKNTTSFDEMVQLDIDYIKTRSLLLDLKIVGLTVPAIIKQALASEAGPPATRLENIS